MSFFDSLGGRIGAGVLTLGLSEVARAANDASQTNYKAQAPQFVNQQYLQGLENQAQGFGQLNQDNSVAYALLKQAQDQQTAQASALAASSRGNVNPALLQRNVMRQAGEAGGQTAQQAAVVGAQEQNDRNKMALAYRQLGLAGAQGQAELNLGAQKVNAGIADTNAQRTSSLIGGVMNAAGGIGARALGAAHGGVIEGQPQVAGDHPANDTVPAMLSPGEIVIPRTKASDPEKAKEFIDQLMSGKKKSSGAEGGYGKVLEAQRKLKEQMSKLEQLLSKKA